MLTLFSDTGLLRGIAVIMCAHNCRQLLTKHFVDFHILNCVYRVKQVVSTLTDVMKNELE